MAWAQRKFLILLLSILRDTLHRVPIVPPHHCSRISPRASYTGAAPVFSQSPSVQSFTLPLPRDACRRVRYRCVALPLLTVAKPLGLAIAENPRIFELRHHRGFHGEIDKVRFRPRGHYFCQVVPGCHRPRGRRIPKCYFDSRAGEACTGR